MADILLTQAAVYALTASDLTPLRLTQGPVYAFASEAASAINVNQAPTYAMTSGEVMPMRVGQAAVYAWTKVAFGEAKVRAWGFALDGHEFYVLRLGGTESLVYDRTTRQWACWKSPGLPYLRAHLGLNWQGFSKAQAASGGLPRHTWNIVGGDDTTGMLWFLDPAYGLDENLVSGEQGFRRKAMAVAVARLRETIPCNQVFLIASLGKPSLAGATATLRTSDNQGATWTDHGALTIAPNDKEQELQWPSLGLIQSPGRLFEISDEGATVRLSSLDMR